VNYLADFSSFRDPCDKDSVSGGGESAEATWLFCLLDIQPIFHRHSTMHLLNHHFNTGGDCDYGTFRKRKSDQLTWPLIIINTQRYRTPESVPYRTTVIEYSGVLL
jgi:hypothetical protein